MSTDGNSLPAPEPGILRFYDAEATVMLSQYNSISMLLGENDPNWTHTGTLCEVLLRDFLRKLVPSTVAIDKGFVFGYSEENRLKQQSSPEIDILIHDVGHYAPLFRQDDFVIVQPDALLGVIQVKRTLAPTESSLDRGITNVTSANLHCYKQFRMLGRHPQITGEHFLNLFSAIVGFGGTMEATTFRDHLRQVYDNNVKPACNNEKVWMIAGQYIPISKLLVPRVVAILDKWVCYQDMESVDTIRYHRLAAQVGSDEKVNIALQILATQLTSHLAARKFLKQMRPFQYPADTAVSETLELLI